jgi:hypothetical protein
MRLSVCCPSLRRCYWLRRCLSSLRSTSSSHILVSRSRRYLANSWETSRRAIRPCTVSLVLCCLTFSISRACCSAIRWMSSSMRPPLRPTSWLLSPYPSLNRTNLRGIFVALAEVRLEDRGLPPELPPASLYALLGAWGIRPGLCPIRLLLERLGRFSRP